MHALNQLYRKDGGARNRLLEITKVVLVSLKVFSLKRSTGY